MRYHKIRCSLATLLIAPLLLAGRSDGESSASHLKDVDNWYKRRIELLTDEGGYLSLVGLFNLREGDNRFGASRENDLIFPKGAPAYAGSIRLRDGSSTFRGHNGVTITTRGEAVREARMIPDNQDGYTVLEMGDFRFYVIERAGEYYLRLKNPKNPARVNFAGIERFPVNESWRVAAHFEPYDLPIKRQIPNVLGYNIDVECTGVIVFEIDGETFQLEPTGTYENEFFVVFGDGTSGLETYGGGRFVYCPVPDEDGNLFIDFNKAYNPPCAFTPYATCPLPHPENQLTVRIEAGEKTFADIQQ